MDHSITSLDQRACPNALGEPGSVARTERSKINSQQPIVPGEESRGPNQSHKFSDHVNTNVEGDYRRGRLKNLLNLPRFFTPQKGVQTP